MDKSWMEERNRSSLTYVAGINSFLGMARDHLASILADKCRCPCRDCINARPPVPLEDVAVHLARYGIAASYRIWVHHGEVAMPPQNQFVSSLDDDMETNEGSDNEDRNEETIEILNDVRLPNTYDSQGAFAGGETEGLGESNSGKFAKLLDEAEHELYHGCKDFSALTFLVELMHIKVLNQMSNKAFEMQLELLKEAFPKENRIPSSYYEANKLLGGLGMGYEAIHACQYDCALFWKEHKDREDCPICNAPRYKHDDGKGTKIPHKVLRYFPLKTRLMRLFASRHTAADMRWHEDQRDKTTPDLLRHPADAEAWKDFDKRYPWFAKDPCNVRLGLATDGFNPFGNMSNAHSTWPVVIIPYNLPPWKCMKEPFSLMTLLIPGPHEPGKDIDVYLQPFIDELKELWEEGVEVYDASEKKENFRMHASLLWTINDFPAYAKMSGWSTQGYLACPVCNEDAPSIKLRSKIGYVRHRRYLPPGHSWRDSKCHDGTREHKGPPKELTGDELLAQMENIVFCNPGKNPSKQSKKRKRSIEERNWTKKSIFYELPYWKSHKIRHKIDVMHTEKNICDNIVGTLLNLDKKNKDTEKARLDLADMNIRKELHLKPRGDKFIKPPACYVIKPEDRKKFCQFLKSVKFPDGYASNISRNAHVNDGKVFGLKSHDCHVLLQRLLPVAIRPYLRREVSAPLIELCNFFHDLCAKTLSVSHLDELEKRIPLILCKMERIFPPAFFDVMVHLDVHLPREAKLVGPVGYSWMYPIERFLGTLKRYVKNRARPEGSIAEAYILKECLTFCSMKHKNELKEESNVNLSRRQRTLFPEWFRKHIQDLHSKKEATDEMQTLAWGVDVRVNSYKACNVNGVKYHSKDREARRTTQNSGLLVDGEHGGNAIEFYGTLRDVIELEYQHGYRIVLFKCDWFDVSPNRNKIRKDYDLTSINVSNLWYEDDPYVLASQAQQVFYVDDHKNGANWKVVNKMEHRHLWDVPEVHDLGATVDEAYQQGGDLPVLSTFDGGDDVEENELDRDDVQPEMVQVNINNPNDDLFETDDEDDETLNEYNNDILDADEIVVNGEDSDIE
ncbi:uncharacterized protein LOC113311461 [Papaver somniferum]|uniref:uncharacterized protein LOC113311461 n=1 Tax=Papaver somniferum TaxID=3469 RepID=UPI000E700ADF|nr:uncharacterized protein LOC113311461 [Papaver somniferum]